MRGDMQAGRREGVGRRRRKQRAGRAESLRLLAGTRGAHWKHAVHVCDAGGVEAQRLVERIRFLPRVESRACGAGRDCGPAGGGDSVQRAVKARLQIGDTEQAWSARGTSLA